MVLTNTVHERCYMLHVWYHQHNPIILGFVSTGENSEEDKRGRNCSSVEEDVSACWGERGVEGVEEDVSACWGERGVEGVEEDVSACWGERGVEGVEEDVSACWGERGVEGWKKT